MCIIRGKKNTVQRQPKKNTVPCIIWKSCTLRVVSTPCLAYRRGWALRGWARSRACRRLLGRRQRQDHSLHTSHAAALPAPPPRRPISRIKTDRAMIELHECSSQSNRIVAYGSKAGMQRVKQVLLALLSKPCPCSMAILAVWPSILFAFNRGWARKERRAKGEKKGGAHAPHPSEIVLDELTEPKARNKLRTLGRAREREKKTSSQESRSSSCEHQRFDNKASDQTLMHEPNDPPKTQKNGTLQTNENQRMCERSSTLQVSHESNDSNDPFLSSSEAFAMLSERRQQRHIAMHHMEILHIASRA